MKKRYLVTSLLAVALGFGIASGLSLASKKSNATVKKVEAAATTRLYLDMSAFTDWSGSASFKVHTWNSANGDKYFKTTNKLGTYYYYADVDLATYASGGGYRFSRFSANGADEWNRGAWNDYSSGVKTYYRATGWTDGSWSTEDQKTWTIVGASSGTWTTQTEDININLEFRFNDEGLQFYNTSVALTAGSVFKIKNSTNNYYGYDCLDTNALTSSYFSGSGSSNITVVTGGTFEFYMKPFEAKFWVQVSSATEADTYAQEFLSTITCTSDSTSFVLSAWNKVGSATTSMEYKYEQLTSGARHLLTSASANESGSNVEKCVARYDRILSKYGYGTGNDQYHDFMSRTPALISSSRVAALGNNSNTDSNNFAAVTLAAIAGISALGGYFVLRKKKLK